MTPLVNMCIHFLAKKILIEGCKQASSNSFNKIGESKELPQRNAGLQNDSIALCDNAPMNSIKFIIQDGWEDFTSVHSIEAVWANELAMPCINEWNQDETNELFIWYDFVFWMCTLILRL